MSLNQTLELSSAQASIKRLYPNEGRHPPYIFQYLTRHAGFASKAITNGPENESAFVRALSWLMALANKLEIDLQESLIRRYPEICPYCITSPCKCRDTKKRPFNGAPAYKAKEELLYKSGIAREALAKDLDSFAGMLSKIYPNNATTWDSIGGYRHTTKLFEELAEVQEAYSKHLSGRKPVEAVAEELADFLAWLLTAWKLSHPDSSLTSFFVLFYEHGCPVCGKDEKKNEACICPDYSDLSGNLVDAERIRKLEELFSKLIEEVTLPPNEASEVQSSLNAAAVTQSEPVARTAVLQTKETVEKIEQSLERGSKGTKNAAAIIQSIKGILETLGFI